MSPSAGRRCLWKLVENCSVVFQGAVGACSSRPRLRQLPQALHRLPALPRRDAPWRAVDRRHDGLPAARDDRRHVRRRHGARSRRRWWPGPQRAARAPASPPCAPSTASRGRDSESRSSRPSPSYTRTVPRAGGAITLPLQLQRAIVIAHDPVIRDGARSLRGETPVQAARAAAAASESRRRARGACANRRVVFAANTPPRETHSRAVDVRDPVPPQLLHQPILVRPVIPLDPALWLAASWPE